MNQWLRLAWAYVGALAGYISVLALMYYVRPESIGQRAVLGAVLAIIIPMIMFMRWRKLPPRSG